MVERGRLAEERTEEFLKPARVSQLTCINRRDSADTDLPRLRNHYWHRRCDRLSMLQGRSSPHDYHLSCLSGAFVKARFCNVCLRHHQQCNGEKQASGCKSGCPGMTEEHRRISVVAEGLRRENRPTEQKSTTRCLRHCDQCELLSRKIDLPHWATQTSLERFAQVPFLLFRDSINAYCALITTDRIVFAKRPSFSTVETSRQARIHPRS